MKTISTMLLAIAALVSCGVYSLQAQDQILGEIRMFGGNFAPRGWAFCNGQKLPIKQHKSLYKLIGTTYGGDGKKDFALPDLNDRVAVGAGKGSGSEYKLGQQGGSNFTKLKPENIPQAGTQFPAYSRKAEDKTPPVFKPGNKSFLSAGLKSNGHYESGQDNDAREFSNKQPSLNVSFIIAIHGTYPTEPKEGEKAVGNPYIGEIGMFAGSYAPQGWKLCDGATLSRGHYGTLAKILDDKYGKPADTNKFRLPDLRGRVAMHAGTGPGLSEFKLGKPGGSESVTLTSENMPNSIQYIFTSSPDLNDAKQSKFKAGNVALLTTELEKNGDVSIGESKKAEAFSTMQSFTSVNYMVAGHGSFPVASKEGVGAPLDDALTGEIRMFAGDFAPSGWVFCDGQLLAISQHDALFAILGTIYGGDGRTTLGLPDLRGRVPVHYGNRYIGAKSGSETMILNNYEVPRAKRNLPTFSPGLDDQDRPEFESGYTALLSTGSLASGRFPLAEGGKSKAFSKMQPYLPVRFIICLNGKFPTRN